MKIDRESNDWENRRMGCCDMEQLLCNLLSEMSDELLNGRPISMPVQNIRNITPSHSIRTDDFINDLRAALQDYFNAEIRSDANRKITLLFPSGDNFEIAIAKL